MSIIQNNTFVGARIQVDGNRFERNRFENCVLVYGGGPLSMIDNVFSGVTWEFVDAAQRTVALLSSFYQSGGESKQFVERLLSTFERPASPPSAVLTTEQPTQA